jgi:hypothetical protein
MGVRCLVGSLTPSVLSRAVRYFFGFSRPSGPAPTPNPAGDGGTVSPPDEVPATSGRNSCPPTPDSVGADTDPPRRQRERPTRAPLAVNASASRRHRERPSPAPQAPLTGTASASHRHRERPQRARGYPASGFECGEAHVPPSFARGSPHVPSPPSQSPSATWWSEDVRERNPRAQRGRGRPSTAVSQGPSPRPAPSEATAAADDGRRRPGQRPHVNTNASTHARRSHNPGTTALLQRTPQSANFPAGLPANATYNRAVGPL